MGRAGGFLQMKKIAGDGRGPPHRRRARTTARSARSAEAAAVHLLASIPNCLILEHLADDVPWRYDIATPLPVTNGQIEVPTKPGLGIEFHPEVALAHPAERNLAPPSDCAGRADLRPATPAPLAPVPPPRLTNRSSPRDHDHPARGTLTPRADA